MWPVDPDRMRWRKSSRSGNGSADCVEVAEVDGGYAVRDSKQRGRGAILTFTRSEWAAFVAGVKLGEFDPR